MCEYNATEERKKRGYDEEFGDTTVEGQAFNDLVRNPILDVGNAVDTFIGADSESGVGLLLSNFKAKSWDASDSKSTPELDTTITPTTATNLDARQGEIDPRLKKKKRNLNSLRIREDLPQQTLTSPVDSQSTGTTNILI